MPWLKARVRSWERGAAVWVAVVGRLDAAEDCGDLALELGEVEVDDGAARMQDDVDGRGEQREGRADSLAQAALDAVAIDGFAERLGHGEADARAGGGGASASAGRECVEVGELLAELLAASLVDELVVGVFAEAVGHRRCETRDAEMRIPALESEPSHTETRAEHRNALKGSAPMSAQMDEPRNRRLVAEACGDGDLVTALGAAAVEDSGAGLGGHANEEAVNFAATAAIGLEGALGHDVRPVSNFEDVCWS